MSDEIVFCRNPQSRAPMAHWMLEAPSFLAIDPMGVRPALPRTGA